MADSPDVTARIANAMTDAIAAKAYFHELRSDGPTSKQPSVSEETARALTVAWIQSQGIEKLQPPADNDDERAW